jgi:DNA modification methylase
VIVDSQHTPYWQTRDSRTVRLYWGHALEVLKSLPTRTVQCIVTSPPYWGLRDYKAGSLELGTESTPQEYVTRLVEIFREARRVLRADGTVWLNLGDTFGPKLGYHKSGIVGIPHRVRFAMEDDGWVTCMEHIWHKPCPMPSSIDTRCTLAHEFVYLFAQSTSYYYDGEAIKEEAVPVVRQVTGKGYSLGQAKASGRKPSGNGKEGSVMATGNRSNRRSVWTIPPQGYTGAHFATFPVALPERCILAGTSEKGACATCGTPYRRITEKETIYRKRPRDYVKRTGEDGTGNACPNTVAGVNTITTGWTKDCPCRTTNMLPCIVLDPFMGSGTTAMACIDKGRHCVGIELREQYLLNNAIPRVSGALMDRPALAKLLPR